MKTLLALAFVAASVGTASAAPLPTPRPCQHKILFLWGHNCYQPGVQDEGGRNNNGKNAGFSRPSRPSAPSASPKGAESPAASPKGADAPSVASTGGGNINPLGGGGGAGGSPPAGDDPGSGGPGLGNPGNDKAVGRAGENPNGKGFGPTGSRGRRH